MESLLSVKIERDECQCCFRTFKSTITYKSPITTELQSVFFDLMNERVNIKKSFVYNIEIVLNSFSSMME